MIDFNSQFIQLQTQRIIECFNQVTGYSLTEKMGLSNSLSDADLAYAFYHAPLAILSHDIVERKGRRDNRYNYANQAALTLFERSFEEQIAIYSTRSASPENTSQTERNNLLAECFSKGSVIINGVRKSSSGKDVILKDAFLFNLFDEVGIYAGQAVVFTPHAK